MRFLYIGQYTDGTTSKMRGETLKQILKPAVFEVIDTHVPFFKCHPLWRSLAFRYKKGKVVQQTNTYILEHLSGLYEVIWVDKAVFISLKVTQKLRAKGKLLIHYTPDTAFEENVSQNFYKSLAYYDYAITTKSFEKAAYLIYINSEKLLYIPQGYNKNLHYPRHTYAEKDKGVVFIGLFESSRGEAIHTLLKHNIPVTLAGKNWESFLAKHKNDPIRFLGESLFNDAYAEAISQSRFSLGLLSKRFPELHTTRTFEIPACGTALVTERNEETKQFYKDDEVIFFKNYKDMVEKILYYLEHDQALESLTCKGLEKVRSSGFDYEQQLRNICQITGIQTQTNS